MRTSETIAELVTALVAAKAKFKAVKESGSNPYFKSRYATLKDIEIATQKALLEAGLVVVQGARLNMTIEADSTVHHDPVMVTRLCHSSGQWMETETPCLSKKEKDPQAMGSAETYARRYALRAILGLATGEDDDAEGAMDRDKKSPQKSNGKAQRAKKKDPDFSLLPKCKDGDGNIYAWGGGPIEDCPSDILQQAMTVIAEQGGRYREEGNSHAADALAMYWKSAGAELDRRADNA